MKRLWRRIRLPLLLTGSVFLLVAGLTGWYAAGRITGAFELREKQTTSRLMGRPYPLLPGQPGTPEQLVERLDHLGYREVQGKPGEPGTFSRRDDWVHVHLRAFKDPRGEHPAEKVRIRFRRGEIDYATRENAALEPVTMALFHGEEMEERDLVTLDQLPDHFLSAILAAEDRRFYLHPGIDPGGVARALWANLTSGAITQGGSTLTQQLAKNLFFSSEKSYLRKGAEAFAAMVLEANYTKDRIFQAYVNEIYLGQHGPVSVRGVARASRHYFGTDVADLDVAQSALLAGMIRAPGRYNPFLHPEKARARRRGVLRAMQEAGAITEAQRIEAEREELPEEQPDACNLNTRAAYVADLLTQDLEAVHGKEFRYENLSIHTTIDSLYQEAAEQAMRRGLENLEKSHPKLKRKEGEEPLQAALISIDLRDGGILAMVGGRGFAGSQFNRVTSARRQPGSLFKPIVYLAGMTAPPAEEDEDRDGFGDDWWEADGDDDVVQAPATAEAGRVEPARRNGRDDEDRIAPAKRKRKWRWFWQDPEPEEEEEPESEEIREVPSMPLTAATVLLDEPYEIKTGRKTWAPRNWDYEFRGPVTVQRALEESLNVPTARAAAAIGLERIIATGHALGIQSTLPEVPALALGTADLTPLEMATVFLDEPYEVKTGRKTWAPRNWDYEFRGPVTVQRALEESLNVPTARAAAAIGLERIIATGHALGIQSTLPEVPALALGTADLTPLEMATVFMTIASGGRKRQPLLMRGVSSPETVLDQSGFLYPGKRLAPDTSVRPAGREPEGEQVVPRKEADLMTALLEGVVEYGTGKSIRALGFEGPAAGKTGTSDGGRDLWFCAYTPRILTLVWVGFDDNAPTHLSGATGALPIWVDYMKRIGADTRVHFDSDKSLSWVAIDPGTGALARRSCPDVRWAPFTPGTEPRDSCRLHRPRWGFWRD